VQKIIPRLHGAYAILIVWEEQPDTLVAFKDGPPLLIGIGQGETVIGSDAQAILPYTKNVIYLEDGEVAHAHKDIVKIYNGKGDVLNKKPEVLNWTAEQAEKHGFKHFMLKEIFEQPKSVASVLEKYVNLEKMQVDFPKIS